jgi:hypothetical protein
MAKASLAKRGIGVVTRLTPEELIAAASPTGQPTWYDRLNAKDKEYVLSIVRLMRSKTTPALSVARILRTELHLDIGIETIRKTLRRMADSE